MTQMSEYKHQLQYREVITIANDNAWKQLQLLWRANDNTWK